MSKTNGHPEDAAPKVHYDAGVVDYSAEERFYYDPKHTPGDTEVLAAFRITPQPGVPREEAAAAVAAESSSGTWTTVWTDLLTDQARYAGRTYEIEDVPGRDDQFIAYTCQATPTCLLHQADYVAACLTGRFDVTDENNALKLGFDARRGGWPAWLGLWAGMAERLPQVVPPGTPVGRITAAAAAATGLPEKLSVVAGTTDGVAGCLASGARRPGDDSTTLGTTLVFKRVSQAPVDDAEGRVYSHPLPDGRWLPGAASNTGAEWIRHGYPAGDLAALDQQAAPLLPADVLAYPLVRAAERFPFRCAHAHGFLKPEADEPVAYAARLQDTAFVERLGYEVLNGLAGPADGDVYGTGGGSRSDVWLQLRADVCGRRFHRAACPEAALGSALLAAVGTVFQSVAEAQKAMVRVEHTAEPDRARTALYEAHYERFLAELRQRGYG